MIANLYSTSLRKPHQKRSQPNAMKTRLDNMVFKCLWERERQTGKGRSRETQRSRNRQREADRGKEKQKQAKRGRERKIEADRGKEKQKPAKRGRERGRDRQREVKGVVLPIVGLRITKPYSMSASPRQYPAVQDDIEMFPELSVMKRFLCLMVDCFTKLLGLCMT